VSARNGSGERGVSNLLGWFQHGLALVKLVLALNSSGGSGVSNFPESFQHGLVLVKVVSARNGSCGSDVNTAWLWQNWPPDLSRFIRNRSRHVI